MAWTTAHGGNRSPRAKKRVVPTGETVVNPRLPTSSTVLTTGSNISCICSRTIPPSSISAWKPRGQTFLWESNARATAHHPDGDSWWDDSVRLAVRQAFQSGFPSLPVRRAFQPAPTRCPRRTPGVPAGPSRSRAFAKGALLRSSLRSIGAARARSRRRFSRGPGRSRHPHFFLRGSDRLIGFCFCSFFCRWPNLVAGFRGTLRLEFLFDMVLGTCGCARREGMDAGPWRADRRSPPTWQTPAGSENGPY